MTSYTAIYEAAALHLPLHLQPHLTIHPNAHVVHNQRSLCLPWELRHCGALGLGEVKPQLTGLPLLVLLPSAGSFRICDQPVLTGSLPRVPLSVHELHARNNRMG